MATRSNCLLVILVALGGCNNTFIDLSPDVEDSEGELGDDGGGTTTIPPPPCGNGVTDPGEECDDGNRLDGDECTAFCLVGAGDLPGDPDPAVRPYVVEGAAQSLMPPDHPPQASIATLAFPATVGRRRSRPASSRWMEPWPGPTRSSACLPDG
jgi:cysteine-rich repeat protein